MCRKHFLAFASGVMVATSVWSSDPIYGSVCFMGRLAFVPACGGLLAGMAFLLLMDRVIPLIFRAEKAEDNCSLKKYHAGTGSYSS